MMLDKDCDEFSIRFKNFYCRVDGVKQNAWCREIDIF